MKKSPNISIIITCKNAHKWLKRCLSSLDTQTYRDFEIVFVDDGSTDESLAFVKKHYPNCIIVQNLKNVGFARANNAGATVSRAPYLFFLNADTYLDPDTIAKLADTLRDHPEYHLMQLDIRKYDKSNMQDLPQNFSMDRFGYPIAPSTIFYADAAAMVIKSDLFFRLQGFDEAYFIYLEDLDIAWRAHLVGESVYFLEGIFVYHHAGGTSISTHAKQGHYITSLRRRYDAQKNNIRSLIKNYELKTLLYTLPVSIVMASIEGWLYLIKGNVRGFVALHNSILWNMLHLVDTLKERQRVQSTRTVGDSEILKMCDKRISKINSFFIHGVPSIKL